MLFSTVFQIGLILALFVAAIGVMRTLRNIRKSSPDRNIRRCVCGYRLENLQVPRCPECGVLIGFKDLKVADLGLTEEDLLDHARKRRPLPQPPGAAPSASTQYSPPPH
jgi:hypothetical protein